MKTLIDKYFAGLTTPEEEQQLLALLRSEPHPSPDHRVLMSMLSARPARPQPEWLEEDATAEFDRLVARRRPFRSGWRWAAVAAAACLVVAVLVALSHRAEEPTYARACLYGHEVCDEALVLGMMEGTLRSALAPPEENRVEGEMASLFNH